MEMKVKNKMNSDKKISLLFGGAIVRVPVPDFYKEQGDSRNLQEVIIRVTDDGFYTRGTSQRTLKQLDA